ncbi:GNAT domain-containing protein [Apiospora arundinis]|uniref:GNAT domain-containing protein n=1 Tax=Apiospora arundinis TaxID=335852 RepID=A0ABR2JPC5_9PEZI
MADPTTPRFYLEPMSEEKHAQAIYEMWQDPVNLAGTGMETAPSLETTHVMIRDRSHSAKPGIENFAIMAGPESPLYKLVDHSAAPSQDLEGGIEGEGEAAAAPKLIGWTGVVRVAPEEIGWYVATPCRGLGVATEAVQAMLKRYWVAQPGTLEVTALISEGNAVSERVATRAGFVRDPERRIANGSMLPNGIVTDRDHAVWALKRPA